MRRPSFRKKRLLPVLGSLLLAHALIWAGLHYAHRGLNNLIDRLYPASGAASGALQVHDRSGHVLGDCPLQHTDVDADIAGYITRVHVRQTFVNPLPSKIEATYVFPLPAGAAVDAMTMTIGDRRIVGVVKPKEEARQIYDQAKDAGHVATLLDQERPNIFTQSVANIDPGAKVEIDIQYVETLKYADGKFEFVFPMVVGPRYDAARTAGNSEHPNSSDTIRVAGASSVNPIMAPPDTRSGHDIAVTVHLNGGTELFDVTSELHHINVQQSAPSRAVVTLKNDDRIPNKDFILHYRTATEEIQDQCFLQPFPGGAYFTLILQPPRRVPATQARPKEMIFVIDRSGSQSGFPIEKAKETMRQCIEGMNPRDTFNLISFADQTTQLFPSPQLNTSENRATALHYVDNVDANGGTEMLPAIQAALSGPADPKRVRIVCFLTDGFVNNDFQIIDAVKKHAGTARVFSFGIGDNVNRFLLDGIAHAGRGEVEYVTLPQEGDAAAKRFHERIQSPVLTDVALDWHGLQPEEVYPRQIPDLFSDKPILVHGILKGNLTGEVFLKGETAQGAFQRRIVLHPPDAPEPHEALPSLWARAKVDELMSQDMTGLQAGHMRPELQRAITDLGVRYRLMTQFTSFVAVDDTTRLHPGAYQEVPVPIEHPAGLSNATTNAAAPPSTMLAQARAGDPLIRVTAPQDAQQVIAVLPGGEIKRLLFDTNTGDWLARFDIPTYSAEGDYFVQVVIVLKDNSRKTLVLRYKVDTTPPVGAAHSRLDKMSTIHLELDTSEDTARVTALLPWGDRLAMQPSANQHSRFSADVTLPPAFEHKAAQVTFLLTDRAHNRTRILMDLNE